MKREKDVISLPIMDKTQGNKVATVRDVIYSRKKFRILGFLVAEGSLFAHRKIIKFKNIESIGNDAIIIKSNRVLEDLHVIPEIEQLLKEKRRIIGEEVLTDNGDSIGIVYDTVFDENTGKVLGFILTDGIFQDLKEGRNVLPYIKGITFGDNALIVPNEITNQFEKNKDIFKKLLEFQ